MHTDGAHCRESDCTGPVVLKVVPVTGAAFSCITIVQYALWLSFVRMLYNMSSTEYYLVQVINHTVLVGMLCLYLRVVCSCVYQLNGQNTGSDVLSKHCLDPREPTGLRKWKPSSTLPFSGPS